MKKSIMKKWVQALRSGEYEQGYKTLVSVNDKGDDCFCVLGVLCNIATEHGVGEWFHNSYGDTIGSSKYGHLAPSVQDWSGVRFGNGLLSHQISLIELNDAKGYTFLELADVIEEYYKEL